MSGFPATRLALALVLCLVPAALLADALTGETEQQATNWAAIVMFALFVGLTLWITRWAARRVRSASDFYAAGGSITGFRFGKETYNRQ